MGGLIAKSDIFKTTLGWNLQEENITAIFKQILGMVFFSEGPEPCALVVPDRMCNYEWTWTKQKEYAEVIERIPI